MIQTTNIDSTKVLDTVRQIIPKETLNLKNTTETIRVLDPISIVDITEKGFDFGLWFSVFVAIISTSILIWNQLKKSKVYGKVISMTYSQTASYSFTTKTKEQKTISGQQYILKLSLSCLRKSLNYKDINVFLTYGKEKVKGEIYWTKYNKLTFHNADGTTSEKQMLTPATDFLTFNSVLEQGKTNFFYLNFIVPNKNGAILYDKIELEFIKPNNNKVGVEIFEIDPKQFFFDDNLLKN
jgi:hypothetical protein